MGTLTFHPWPVRRADVDHPDELRIDLDPQPGTTFTDAVRVAGVARELLEELGLRGYAKTSAATAACTSSSASSRAGSSSTSGTPRSASAASWSGATTASPTAWWKEERGERIFVDYNQNCRDRTIASAYSLRPMPGRPGLDADDLGRAGRRHRPARRSTCSRCPTGSPTATRGPASTTRPTRSSRCWRLWEELPGGELNFPPDYPKMPGEPPRVQPSKKVAAHWDEDGNRLPD